MESFAALKRRTTEVLQSLPQNLPTMPSVNVKKPSFSSNSGPKPMKGTWEKIDVPPLARSSHTINVVNGSAYVFGGEINPREPVDNDVHIIRLPYNSAGADYYKIKSVPPKQYTPPAVPEPFKKEAVETTEQPTVEEKAEQKEQLLDDVSLASPSAGPADEESLNEEENAEVTVKDKGKGLAAPDVPVPGDVPAPRVGHASAVIGSRIFVFGGRGGADMTPLEEAGRVWVFDTRTNTWTYLDPVPPAPGVTILPMPSARSYHSAAATDRPRDFAPKRTRRAQSWKAWAVGDSAEVGIPQAPIVGHLAANAVDEEDEGYGTFFVHGGCLASGERTNDLWAFDVRSRVWSQLPSAPGPARGGAAIAVSKSRLFRFGGFDGKGELGGQLDFLHLEMDTFDDGVSKGEIAVHGRGGWQSIVQGANSGEDEIQLIADQVWPGHRSVAGLEAVTVGAGREYLLLIMGEREPSPDGHSGAGAMWDDVWAFQVPPLGMTAASVRDAMWQTIGWQTGEGKWTRLTTEPYDDDNDDGEPAPRGWFASAPMGDVEESGVVIWGGLSSENKRLHDGWILRLPV
ncbi:kelch domain-containing protein [Colletotrichum truncatum]|uniref:Kelch domain-containing protein n=1 Tax=Colletotrichum truncatum TaxID=5467 RepID=A0ACC3ZF02_COLTU|nr:kelch domain-containing protein [Colletotrichum truncatum]KAF6801397.1 kelch domain-containing protein [Colletotrichum truncatum]